MSARDFCFWLQGMFEIARPKELTPEQTAMVKRHLDMVFAHEIAPAAKAAAPPLPSVSTTGILGGTICGGEGLTLVC